MQSFLPCLCVGQCGSTGMVWTSQTQPRVTLNHLRLISHWLTDLVHLYIFLSNLIGLSIAPLCLLTPTGIWSNLLQTDKWGSVWLVGWWMEMDRPYRVSLCPLCMVERTRTCHRSALRGSAHRCPALQVYLRDRVCLIYNGPNGLKKSHMLFFFFL